MNDKLIRTTCTMHNEYYSKQLTQNFKPANFHPALYSLMQKGVKLNTYHIVKKFLTEQLIKSIWQVGLESF